MPNPTIVSYIKQNLRNGFSKTEVGQALLSAGWNESEIAQAFDTVKDSRKGLLPIILILVVTPILGFGGAWFYAKYGANSKIPAMSTTNSGEVAGAAAESQEEKAARDQQKISDIRTIQQALEKYFSTHQLYTKKLSELVTEGFLPQLPLDPKNGEPYLYNPLGEPPLYYSLSFILETGAASLKSGFNSVTSETKL